MRSTTKGATDELSTAHSLWHAPQAASMLEGRLQHTHLVTAALARVLARRCCLRRSAGSSIASKSGVGMRRRPLLCASPIAAGPELVGWLALCSGCSPPKLVLHAAKQACNVTISASMLHAFHFAAMLSPAPQAPQRMLMKRICHRSMQEWCMQCHMECASAGPHIELLAPSWDRTEALRVKGPPWVAGNAGAGLSLPTACCLPGSSCPEGVAPTMVEVVLGPDEALSMASSPPLPAVAAAWLGGVSSDLPTCSTACLQDVNEAKTTHPLPPLYTFAREQCIVIQPLEALSLLPDHDACHPLLHSLQLGVY